MLSDALDKEHTMSQEREHATIVVSECYKSAQEFADAFCFELVPTWRAAQAVAAHAQTPLVSICPHPEKCEQREYEAELRAAPAREPDEAMVERANSHSHIIDQARYWLSRIDTRDPDLHRLLLERNMVVTSLVGERAKPAASDLERAKTWRSFSIFTDATEARLARNFAAVRREAAADMRARDVQWHISESRRARQSAMAYPEDSDDRRDFLEKAIWHYDCVSALRALPLTEEETIPKAEGTSNG